MSFDEGKITFQEADRRYTELRREQESGNLGDEEFDAELKQLMVQDPEGRWWAKSPTTGEWHYHDGTAWVKDTPPGYQTPQAAPEDQPEAQLTEGMEEQELERRVAAVYAEGQRHMDAREWQQALECFEEVKRLEPGYRDTEELLSQVHQELAPPPTVEVPDLSGQEVSQASSTLAGSGLKLGAQGEAPSATVSKGRIIEQRPASGTKVEAGNSVDMKISSGSSTVEVPNLAGMSRFEARSTLSNANLALGMTARAPSDDVPEGRIINQSPVAGSKVERGSSVRITINSGSPQAGLSADTQPQPLLHTLAAVWWAVALRGLAVGILGLIGSFPTVFAIGSSVWAEIGIFVIADGVFAFLASRTAGRRSLLQIQSIISGATGLTIVLSDTFNWYDFPNYVLALWAIGIGIIYATMAIQLGWGFKMVRLMAIGGALLVLFGGFLLVVMLGSLTPQPWLLGIWLMLSGVSLVAFAFWVRNEKGTR